MSSKYHSSSPKTIQSLFGTIAPCYDRVNALLSFGLHKRWNRGLVRALQGQALLDLCAGTGDIGLDYLQLHPQAHAILLDFCPEMLGVATHKGAPLRNRFETLVGDAEKIPLSDNCCDAVSIAYGIRNVCNRSACFKEVYRTLRPGGHFGILELTRPPNPLLALGHRLYLSTLLPLLGKWVAKNREAYTYLARSIGAFPSPSLLEQELREAGFTLERKRLFMGGVTTLWLLRKPR